MNRYLDEIAQAVVGGKPPLSALLSHSIANGSHLSSKGHLPVIPKILLLAINTRTWIVLDNTNAPEYYYTYEDSKESEGFRLSFSVSLNPTDQFIFNAYHAVLGRAPDVRGRDTYNSLLREGQLNAAQVFMSLLSSDEARDRPGFLIVLPSNSTWLSEIGHVPPALMIEQQP